MRQVSPRISGGGGCFQGGRLLGRGRRLAPPERLEVRAAPGGGVAGLMALGAWYAWPDDPDEDRDLWHILGPNDLLFTVTATDGSTMSFSLTQSDDGLESRLLDSEWNVPMVETDRLPGGGLDPYRAMAVDRIAGMSKHLFGTGLDTDALWDSPAVDELAVAFAAGVVSSIRSGATPLQAGSAPAAGLDGPIAMTMDDDGWDWWNTPPEAAGDLFMTLHDVPLFEPPDGVMWNDYDPDGDPITAVLDLGPLFDPGFILSPDGSFSYVPPPMWSGGDAFMYHVTDGTDNSETVTVEIGVINYAPVAEEDYGYETLHDMTLVVPATEGVLRNDYDPDGDPFRAWLDTGPTHAVSFNLSGDGSFRYEPPAGWAGSDSFTYYLSDGIDSGTNATVGIGVMNTVPEVGDDGAYTVETGETITVDPPGLRLNDFDPDWDKFSLNVETNPAHGTLDYFDDDLNLDGEGDGGFTYTADLGYTGPDYFTYYADDGVQNSADNPVGQSELATVMIDVMPKCDLDVATISHNVPTGWLSDNPSVPGGDSPETLPGAFLPLNDDDDDYDANRTPDYQQREQAGPIEGENDLLPIALRPVEPLSTGGTYYLNILGGLRVWEYPDRTGEVNSWLDPNASSFNATVPTLLYVEGISEGPGSITLVWENQPYSHNWFADTVDFTVFRWQGPLNVPDYSIHEYTAWGTRWEDSTGMGHSGKWLSPVGGSVPTIPGAYNPFDSVADDEAWPNSIFIHWQGGPQIGKPVFEAHPDYVWDLDVNVVQIVVESPDSNPAWQTNPEMPESGIPVPQPGTGILLQTVRTERPLVAPPLGVEWRAKVDLIGPDRGVSHRGEKEMRIGFIQTVEFMLTRGTYQSGKSLVWDIEGNSYLDVPEACKPLYSDHVGATLDASRGDEYPKEIVSGDSPCWGVPYNYECAGGGGDRLDYMDLVWPFNTYVIARTSDPRNGASTIYTPRAVGSWEFDATGDITVSEFDNLHWTQTGCGLTVPAGWTPLTDGKQVHTSPPMTTGELATPAAYNGPWSDPTL